MWECGSFQMIPAPSGSSHPQMFESPLLPPPPPFMSSQEGLRNWGVLSFPAHGPLATMSIMKWLLLDIAVFWDRFRTQHHIAETGFVEPSSGAGEEKQ